MSLKKLFELKNIIKEDTIRLTEDSVDSQIDSVLLRYQNDSSVEDEDIEGMGLIDEGYSMPDNWNLLLEADEEEPDVSTDDIVSIGDEMPRSTTPSDPREQKIDIDNFAQQVANLYENYENLLNIKPVIVHRAIHLLEKGYPAELIDEFVDILEREFGITPEGDAEEELEAPPPGGSAGPIGA